MDPIMYPADSVVLDLVDGALANYTASVGSGTAKILTDMQLIDSRCHDHVRYILAGYSQGAWAVHDAPHLMQPAQLGRVIGVALFGDPDFVPAQSIVRDYKLADWAVGDSALLDHRNVGVPRPVAARSGSLCYPTDPVCQLTKHNITTELPFCVLGSRLLCPHLRYAIGGETAKAEKFLLPFLA